MRLQHRPFLLLLFWSLALVTQAQTPDTACRIQPFRGASSPLGADVKASMVNRGQTCQFLNYGIPEERANPAESGRIVRNPLGGNAVFRAPAALYTPNPGFVGTDAFEYEAMALGRSGSPIRLLVRVTVEVTAP